MKRLIFALSIIFTMTSQAWAGKSDIDISALLQNEFKDLSQQVGLAVAYKPTAPAEPLGVLGFDIGIEVTFVDIDEDDSYWKTAAPDLPGLLPVPKIHVQKGLPLNIDVGAIYSEIPSSDISLWGAELKWAFIEGGTATPAVAIRATYTELDGINGLDLETKGVDISVSKGFAMLTPYGGVGQVWIKSDPTGFSLNEETFSETKFFAGLKVSMALLKVTVEAEFAEIPSYTLKFSLGF